MNQKGATMASERYPVHGWLVFGAWMNWNKERNAEWSKELTADQIAAKFNNCAAKVETNLKDISPGQVRYVFRMFNLDYKRKYPQ